MILHPSAIVSISGARNAALVVSFTFNEVMAAINLDHVGSASRSPRSHIETQGAECAFVASPETHEKDGESDMGILGGCAENEQCVKDDTSSLGGRCAMFGAEEGVTKAHRDLVPSACSGTYPNDCIPCTMANSTPGKKCDGFIACDGVNTTKISCGSCNGRLACRHAAGTIGESSCNGKNACYKAAGPVGESSCNSIYACTVQNRELNSYSSIKFTNSAKD
jgi:hypothetical protein